MPTDIPGNSSEAKAFCALHAGAARIDVTSR
jgi:hypothetical protein